MPSTFTPNLNIEKPADGEQSGLWGQTVNSNMTKVDSAFPTFASNAYKVAYINSTATGLTSGGLATNANAQWTFTAASTGATATINAASGNYSAFSNAAASSWSGVALAKNGTVEWALANSLAASGYFSLYNQSRGADALTVTPAGNFTLAAPSSGDVLTSAGNATFPKYNLSGLTNAYVAADVGTGNPGVSFDANDFIDYSRASNIIRGVINNVVVTQTTAGAFAVAGSVSVTNNDLIVTSTANGDYRVGFNAYTATGGFNVGTGSSTAVALMTAATPRVTIGAAGNVAVAAPASGVALAATGVTNTAAISASTGISVGNTANTDTTVLDYYQEGTWTPTITGAGAVSYPGGSSGWYTRIGNRVFFGGTIGWTGGTAGNSISVSNFPFTPSAGVLFPAQVAFNYSGAALTPTNQIMIGVFNGGASMALLWQSTSGASTVSAVLNPASGTRDIMFSGSYVV